MAFSDSFIRALGNGIALALTPLVMYGLSRLAPPRRGVAGEAEQLKRKYGRLEFASVVVYMIAVAATLAVIVVLRVDNPWALGVLIAAPVAASFGLAAIGTLFRSRRGWSEFWRYYELKYRVSVGLVLPLYGFLMGLGVVSVLKLLGW